MSICKLLCTCRDRGFFPYSLLVVFALAPATFRSANCFLVTPSTPPILRRPSSLAVHATVDTDDSLDRIQRIFCISDLHTDNAENMSWLENKCAAENKEPNSPGEGDLLVVAGDISHDMGTFQKTMRCLLALQCQVLFVPGNHEAWLPPKSYKEHRHSLDKLQLVQQTCRRMGVHTEPILVGSNYENPLWVVPMQSWYDGSLSIEGCDDLCRDFKKWPWTDFLRCRWPQEEFPLLKKNDKNARIPSGLNEYFLRANEETLRPVRKDKATSVLTVSHFLPNSQSLPDWKDLDSPTFLRNEWLDHGAAPVSAKFAKVAGSSSLDTQVRSLFSRSRPRILHKFGHSHRPKDFEFQNVRYIHNPLGKPRERDMRMIAPDVDFQLVWDTTSGEVRGETVLRYWEEKGGGKDALIARFDERKRKRSVWARKRLSR